MLFRNFIVSLFKESVNNWLVIVNEWNEIKEVPVPVLVLDSSDCEDYLQELGVALKSLCIDDEIDADESDFVIYCCE